MRSFLLSTSLLLAALPGFAQLRSQATLGGTIGLTTPTGEFERTWGRDMLTLGAHLGFPLGVPFLQGGFAFDYSRMGEADQTVPVNNPDLAVTEGELTVRAKVLSYHPLLRFSPLRGKVRPYVDGLVGFRQFTTLSRVTVDGLEQPVSEERSNNDLAFSTGWAAGLMVTWGGIAYVEARVERFNSGEATYVDPASITVSDQGTVGFNTLTSRTDAVNVLLGIGLRF